MIRILRPVRRAVLVCLGAVLLQLEPFGALAPPVVHAELLGQGPIALVGIVGSDDKLRHNKNLELLQLGWQWRMEGPKVMDDLLAHIGAEFSWKVEALGGVFVGNRSSVEASLVPLFRIEPATKGDWVPYFEGGIGLIYNDLRGYDLGSRILFSDNGGVGVSWNSDGDHRWSLGYRFRHISHAGLWADSNKGLNTHSLALTFE